MTTNTLEQFLQEIGAVTHGHILVSTGLGTGKHVSSWVNTMALASNPGNMKIVADLVTDKLTPQIESERLQTVLLAHSNFQATAFATLVGAALSDRLSYRDISVAAMEIDQKSHRIVVGRQQYERAERVIAIDLACYSTVTLRTLITSVTADRVYLRQTVPEMLAVSAIHLHEKDASHRLGRINFIVGTEVKTLQSGLASNCELCKKGLPLTHNFDPVTGFAKIDRKAEERRQEQIRAAAAADDAAAEQRRRR